MLKAQRELLPEVGSRAEITELHAFLRWPSRHLLPMLVVFVTLLSAIAAVWTTSYWLFVLLLWPALGYLMFLFVLAFHDASHGRLHPVPWINEFYGHLLGSFSFVPLSVYRFAHARHHAHLGTRRDFELWPFNIPDTARPVRVLAAWFEILLGCVYSPLLFLRAVLVGKPTPRERRNMLTGYVLCCLLWSVNLGTAYYFGQAKLLLGVLLVPFVISGMLQTLNKYMQHLGLHGRTVLGLTRTVVDKQRYASLISASLLYNDYHGTHHRYAKIPYYNLPSATPWTLSNARESCPVFPSVHRALFDMFPCLLDPKVGPQWLLEDSCQQLAITSRR